MKRFKNNVISQDVAFAIMVAEKMLSEDSAMMRELSEKNDFRFNSGNGFEVCQKILACTVIAPVFTYRPKVFWSKAMGYSDGKAIHLNLRKLDNFNLHELTGLLVHEYLHLVGFSHGSNFPSTEKNQFSVNFFCSQNIKRWL